MEKEKKSELGEFVKGGYQINYPMYDGKSTVIKQEAVAKLVAELKSKPNLTPEERALIRDLESPISFKDWKPMVFGPSGKFTILDKSGSVPNYDKKPD